MTPCEDHNKPANLFGGQNQRSPELYNVVVTFDCRFISWKKYKFPSLDITIRRGNQFEWELPTELETYASLPDVITGLRTSTSWSEYAGCEKAGIVSTPYYNWISL